MVIALNTAVSGLNAASQQIQAAANNIANQQSVYGEKNGQPANVPYTPQDVVQSSLENGGVQTYTRNATTPTVPVYQPDNPVADESGVVQYPGVDQASEAVNIILANNSYKASLKTMKTYDDMMQNLLDIKG